MAISLGHQESGNVFSHLNHAPPPPMTVQQQLQSMAAAMTGLT